MIYQPTVCSISNLASRPALQTAVLLTPDPEFQRQIFKEIRRCMPDSKDESWQVPGAGFVVGVLIDLGVNPAQ